MKVRSFTTSIFLAIAAWGQTGPLQTPPDPSVPNMSVAQCARHATRTSGPASTRTLIISRSRPVQRRRNRQDVRAATAPAKRTSKREAARRPSSLSVELAPKTHSGQLSELPRQRRQSRRDPPIGTHTERRRVYELSLDSSIGQHESLCSPRSRRISATTVTRRSARSSICPPSIG